MLTVLAERIALTMASYIAIRMLQTYASLEARDIRPWVERHGLGLLSRNGVHVALSDAPSVPREFTNSHRYQMGALPSAVSQTAHPSHERRVRRN
jgi:hypothetical protein